MQLLKLHAAIWLTCLAGSASDAIVPAMRFEPNLGQTDPGVAFISRAPGHTVFLTPATATVRTASRIFTIALVGANPEATAFFPEPAGAPAHYIVAGRPNGPVDVPTYDRVGYGNVYPGIDVIYYDNRGLLGYLFVVHASANPALIRFLFRGIDNIETDGNGDPVFRAGVQEARQAHPHAHQLQGMQSEAVETRFSILGRNALGIDVAKYDRTRPLVVDAGLNYSTYLGGTGQNNATAVAVDAAGNAYVTGWTESLDFPEQSGPRIGSPHGVDVYVAKVNSTGQGIYISYLGGTGDDRAFGIAVDASNCPIVVGGTYSSNFPISNAVQARFGGGRDAFIAKLNSAGTGLIFSTYLGGSGLDSANAVTVDTQGNIYVAGETTSPGFPVVNYYQRLLGGGTDSFVAKLSGTGALIYSTFLGGTNDDRATAIAVDTSGNAYVAGSTSSSDFPVVNAFQKHAGGGQDAFAAKLGPSGNALIYCTFLGGSGVGASEVANAIAVDSSGAAYIAGTTNSTDFPLSNPAQSFLNGSQDAFLVKVAPSGDAVVYGTYFGGSGVDVATALTVDITGRAYVAGYTASTDLPAINAVQSSSGGGYDAFVATLSPSGTIEMATYLGGAGSDSAYGIGRDVKGDVLVVGQTFSSDFPVGNGCQSSKPAPASAFLAVYSGPPGLSVSISHSGNFMQGQAGAFYIVTVTNKGSGPTSGPVTLTVAVPAGMTLVSIGGTGWSCSGGACARSDVLAGGAAYPSVTITVNVASNASASLSTSATVSGGGSATANAADPTSVSTSFQAANLSVSPNSGAGLAQVFTATYSDSIGYQDIGPALFMVASDATGVSGCFAMWIQTGNLFYLGNDAANNWLGPIQGGSSGTLQNSQCVLNAATSSGSGAGGTATVKFGLTFLGGFAGLKNLYQMVFGTGGNTAWQQKGTWSPGAAQAPVNLSVTPGSGSGVTQVFSASYSDAQGYRDIDEAFFMVAANATGVGGCFAMWIQAGNLFYLGNDSATVWIGPIQGASNATLQNSQCTLNGSTSSGSGAGDTLTVKFGLSFAAGFTGPKTTYQMVFGSGGNTAWQQIGTWTPTLLQFPVNVATAPNAGAGASQVFTANYSDAQGYQDISRVFFMVAGSGTGVAGCFAMLVPVANQLYLGNDSATVWVGPIQAGSSASLQNSQCILNGATSSGSGAGSILTATFGLSFLSGFTGPKNIYQMVFGGGGNTGWELKGSWNPTASPPTNVSVSPASGTGTNQVFAAAYADAQGYQDITFAFFMVAGNGTGIGGCFAMWVPSSNLFYLGNDAATAWLGPVQGGSTSTIQNSQCTLNGAASSGNGTGSTLTVHFGLSFAGSFTGTKNTYQMVFGAAGNTGWQPVGAWIP